MIHVKDYGRVKGMERSALLDLYPDGVWDSAEAFKEFAFLEIHAPFASVIRKSDGKRGSLEFQHNPRFYFDFRGE